MASDELGQRLDGKVALVTGGGSGIGRAISLRLARAGATVAVASRKHEHLDDTVAEIAAAGGVGAAYTANIRIREEVERLVDAVVERHGRIDVLVNNAGGQFLGQLLDLSENGWKAVVDLNLNGTFNCLQLAGRRMVEQGGGAIVNVITAASLGPAPGRAHSGAARSAVVSLTRSAAFEWARHGVRVNAIAPGPVLTEGLEAELGDAAGRRLAELARAVPLRRLADPAEIAAGVLYLTSPVAAFVTGNVLVIDGGFSLAGTHDYLTNDGGTDD